MPIELSGEELMRLTGATRAEAAITPKLHIQGVAIEAAQVRGGELYIPLGDATMPLKNAMSLAWERGAAAALVANEMISVPGDRGSFEPTCLFLVHREEGQKAEHHAPELALRASLDRLAHWWQSQLGLASLAVYDGRGCGALVFDLLTRLLLRVSKGVAASLDEPSGLANAMALLRAGRDDRWALLRWEGAPSAPPMLFPGSTSVVVLPPVSESEAVAIAAATTREGGQVVARWRVAPGEVPSSPPLLEGEVERAWYRIGDNWVAASAGSLDPFAGRTVCVDIVGELGDHPLSEELRPGVKRSTLDFVVPSFAPEVVGALGAASAAVLAWCPNEARSGIIAALAGGSVDVRRRVSWLPWGATTVIDATMRREAFGTNSSPLGEPPLLSEKGEGMNWDCVREVLGTFTPEELPLLLVAWDPEWREPEMVTATREALAALRHEFPGVPSLVLDPGSLLAGTREGGSNEVQTPVSLYASNGEDLYRHLRVLQPATLLVVGSGDLLLDDGASEPLVDALLRKGPLGWQKGSDSNADSGTGD